MRRCLSWLTLVSCCSWAVVAQAETKPSASHAKPSAAARPSATKKQTSSASPSAATKPAAGSKSAAEPAANPRRNGDGVIGNAAVRRTIAAAPTHEEQALGAESPELAALRAAERELFPPAAPPLGSPWPRELPFTSARPELSASGLPNAPISAPSEGEGGADLSWLQGLTAPDLPLTWHPRVVRYIEHFTKDPRGRSSITIFAKRAGRYEAKIRAALRQRGMPEDLLWLSMVESAHDPRARSPVGAAGLWQFMPETGKVYGLSQDRWADQRLHPEAATEAAVTMLGDLFRRFGSWELAMAAYNMGYGGVLGVMKRYNSNDYWALSELEGSLPWETTLYVPKIVALAVVMRNLERFGFQNLNREPALDGVAVTVAPQTQLSSVAAAAGVKLKDIESLNPELRAGRTPPDVRYAVRVPRGKAEAVSRALDKGASPTHASYTLRAGESLADVASQFGTSVDELTQLNQLSASEALRPGTVLLLPPSASDEPDEDAALSDVGAVVVPQRVFSYPDRKRVFYRVITGDTLSELAKRLGVAVDDLRKWNALDAGARLQEGMTLQAFVPRGHELQQLAVLSEQQVRIVPVGGAEFFELWESKGRTRKELVAKAGDTLESLGAPYGVSGRSMERINRRSRTEVLRGGERVIVYAEPNAKVRADKAKSAASSEPASAQATLGDAVLEPLPAP